MSNIASALVDKDFQSAMPADQIKYLSSIDKDFASAHPNDQVAYLNHIKGNTGAWPYKSVAQPDTSENANFGREANEFNLKAASAASGLPETMHPVRDLFKQPVPGLDANKSMLANVGDVAAEGFEKSLGPGYALGKSLYGAGKSLFAPTGAHEDPEDAAIRRAGGAGTIAGTAAPLAIGEGINKAPGELHGVARSVLLDPVTGKPTVTPSTIAERVLRTPEEKSAAALANAPSEPITNSPNRANAQYLDKQHSLFADQLSEVEAARQKELANQERLKEQDAQSRMRRGVQQGRLDEAHAQRLSEAEQARQKELADQERFKEQHAGSLNAREAETSPIGSRIQRPAAQALPPSEGRPATWTNEVVKERAAWGDPDAIAQARERGFGRIPLKFSTAETNPRSVTRFDAEGVPIGNQTPFGGLKPGGLMQGAGSLKLSTDSLGVRWAESPEGYRVSIPKGIAEADVEAYAHPKLAEQARIHAGMKSGS